MIHDSFYLSQGVAKRIRTTSPTLNDSKMHFQLNFGVVSVALREKLRRPHGNYRPCAGTALYTCIRHRNIQLDTYMGVSKYVSTALMANGSSVCRSTQGHIFQGSRKLNFKVLR